MTKNIVALFCSSKIILQEAYFGHFLRSIQIISDENQPTLLKSQWVFYVLTIFLVKDLLVFLVEVQVFSLLWYVGLKYECVVGW